MASVSPTLVWSLSARSSYRQHQLGLLTGMRMRSRRSVRAGVNVETSCRLAVVEQHMLESPALSGHIPRVIRLFYSNRLAGARVWKSLYHKHLAGFPLKSQAFTPLAR